MVIWQQIYVSKEGNVLLNDALNTFYLWLYGIRYMVSKEGNILFNDTLEDILFTVIYFN